MATPQIIGTCDVCLAKAPVQKVVFKQNIGALVMHFHKSMEGDLCRTCVNQHFTRFGLITFFFGWWGVKSMLLTPFYLLSNVFNYLSAWSLPPVPPGTASLKAQELERLRPFTQSMMLRLQEGTALDTVTADVAKQALVSNDQVVRYLTVVMERVQEPPAA